MRPFFHGLHTKWWKAYQTEWRLSYVVFNSAMCSGVSGQGRRGALFMNYQEEMIFKATLKDLWHPQPRIPVHCNNVTAVVIANNTIKCQRSHAMEMKYFWTYEKDAQKVILFKWHPGMENLADYQSKHHPGGHHTAVRPYYLHKKNTPLELPRAMCPSTLKGCVGTLTDGYVRNVPLSRVQRIQSGSHDTTTRKHISVSDTKTNTATCFGVHWYHYLVTNMFPVGFPHYQT
jgi:hypothetical protein